MMRRDVTVLITGVGGGGVGEQTLKSLRLAGGYRLIGVDVRARCAQFALVDHAVTVPAADDPSYVEALLTVCRSFGVDAVFPGSEPELRVLSVNRAAFQSSDVLVPINPPEVISTCMDKLATATFLAANGFDAPRSFRVETLQDLDAITTFPLVIKPSVGSGGSRDCFIVQTPRELRLLTEYVLGTGARLMAQEYVGTPEDEYTVGVLLDLDGVLLNSIAMRRSLEGQLHQRVSVANVSGRRELGERLVISSGVSHGEVDRFPDVTLPCERLAVALGARGAINVQCRLVRGEVKVFEINPRLSGTTSIRAMLGYNEPDVLLRRHLLGEVIEPHFEYESGLVLRSLTETIVPDVHVESWTSL